MADIKATLTSNNTSLTASINQDTRIIAKSFTNESRAAIFADASLTGVPTAPTAIAGTNTTQIATTEFVTSAVQGEDTIAEMNDVTLTSLADGEVLVSSSGNFINQTLADAGINAITLTTAAQPNITSVGTLTSATISGDLTVDTDTLKVDSTNNRVGINVAVPAGDLHVVGETGTAGRIYLSDVDNGIETVNSLLITKSGTNAYIYNRDGGNLGLGSNDDIDAVIIKSDGNVGIGTTTPSVKLEVVGNVIAATPTADTHLTTKLYVDTQVAGVVNSAPAALDTLNELAAALGDDASFATTTATSIGEKLAKANNLSDLNNVATARTNLGLGTAATTDSTAYAPAAGSSSITTVGTLTSLTVTGQIELTSGAVLSSHGNFNIVTGTCQTAAQPNITSVGTLTGLSVSGNVGIGTTSPQGHLDINTENAEATEVFINGEANQSKYLKIRQYEASEAGLGNNLVYIASKVTGVGVLGSISAAGAETDALHWDENGNVGIGTTSPAKNLHITHSSAPTIRFARDLSYYWDIGHTGSDFQFTSQTPGVVMHMNHDGNIGIATTDPQTKLHVNEGIILADGSSTNHGFELRRDSFDTFQMRHLGGNFTIRNFTDNRTDLSIDGAGNVGIGTATPSEALDVNGNIKASGSITGNSLTLIDGPTLTAGSTSFLTVTTDHGYVAVGPANTSFSHFSTDRAKFYFNKQIIVDEGIVSAYNEHDLILTTGSSPTTSSTGVFIKNSTHEVGINNNAPTEALDVTGNIKASGSITGANLVATSTGIKFSDYTSTSVGTATTSIDPNQSNIPADGAGNDTTTDLAVDQTGNVVRTTQEATWTFSRAEIDGLAAGTAGAATLINAPGTDKFVIIEKATFLLNYAYNGGTMNSGQSYAVVQDGNASDIIAVMPALRVLNITKSGQSASSSDTYGIFEHDTGYSTLNRTYKPNKATIFRKASSSTLATAVTSMTIKIRYRVYDVASF